MVGLGGPRRAPGRPADPGLVHRAAWRLVDRPPAARPGGGGRGPGHCDHCADRLRCDAWAERCGGAALASGHSLPGVGRTALPHSRGRQRGCSCRGGRPVEHGQREWSLCRGARPGRGVGAALAGVPRRGRPLRHCWWARWCASARCWMRSLREAQKLEALGTMAGGIAHDFNNILGAILGFGEMAAERAGDNPRLRQPIAAILDAGRRGKALVDQILAVSRRAPQGAGALTPATVLREVRDLLAGSMPPGVTLRLRVEDENARVMGDATRLHQLVMNLATNGIDAMPQGRQPRAAAAHSDDRCAHRAVSRQASARPLRRHRRERYRQRHLAAGAGADLRALLHHQRTGPWNRPRPGAGLRDHQGDERSDRAHHTRRERARSSRSIVPALEPPASDGDRGCGARPARIVPHRPGGGRRSV